MNCQSRETTKINEQQITTSKETRSKHKYSSTRNYLLVVVVLHRALAKRVKNRHGNRRRFGQRRGVPVPLVSRYVHPFAFRIYQTHTHTRTIQLTLVTHGNIFEVKENNNKNRKTEITIGIGFPIGGLLQLPKGQRSVVHTLEHEQRLAVVAQRLSGFYVDVVGAVLMIQSSCVSYRALRGTFTC